MQVGPKATLLNLAAPVKPLVTCELLFCLNGIRADQADLLFEVSNRRREPADPKNHGNRGKLIT